MLIKRRGGGGAGEEAQRRGRSDEEAPRRRRGGIRCYVGSNQIRCDVIDIRSILIRSDVSGIGTNLIGSDNSVRVQSYWIQQPLPSDPTSLDVILDQISLDQMSLLWDQRIDWIQHQ